ncbi:hypothetical protein BY458DRAFT_514077 [Sporodiniella umbellata]|nr:hypothetical protein BY458DRAFT_514077 [Sporodiniella umbellata]
MTQNKQSLIIYGAAAVLVAALSSGIVYYVIEDDRKVQRRKAARRAERNALKLLNQITEQRQAIEKSIKSIEPVLEIECDDKTFQQKEFTLVQCNELLLRLMEQLDAMHPSSLIIPGEAEPTELEEKLTEHLKTKKRSLVESINELFRCLDVCNETLKKEKAKREEAAKEKARFEKQEQERLAREAEERKKIEEEKAKKAREEQERVAQEEALLRQKEEEEQLAREAEQKAKENIMAQEESLPKQEESEQKTEKTKEQTQEHKPRDIEQIEVESPEEGSGVFVQAEPSTIELSE